jgi:integrase
VRRQAEGAANSTVNRDVAVLLRMLRLGMEHGKVARLPIVHKPKEAPPRSGFFEADAFAAVRAHLPEDLQVAVSIAYTYGWRMQSEVLALELRHLDLAAGTLCLDPGTTKNDEGRIVYLTPELTALLTVHVGRVQALSREMGRVLPWLFPHFTGPQRGRQRYDFRKAWQRACRAAGYPGMLRHDFRRTAVRNMINRSIPERVAMTITGHKTRAVFDRYHIVSPGDLQEAARKMALGDSATMSATPRPVIPCTTGRRLQTRAVSRHHFAASGGPRCMRSAFSWTPAGSCPTARPNSRSVRSRLRRSRKSWMARGRVSCRSDRPRGYSRLRIASPAFLRGFTTR